MAWVRGQMIWCHSAASSPSGPPAWVVSVRSPDPCDQGSGWQWFSVRGVTENSRPARIAEAMPVFVRSVRD